MDLGEPIDIIYLDFAKALDEVPLLLAKLGNFGMRANLLLWIKVLSIDRQLSVRAYRVFFSFDVRYCRVPF